MRQTKQQKEAIKAHLEFIATSKEMFHPDDIIFEPQNFKAWVISCDSVDVADLKNKIQFLEQIIATATPSEFLVAHQYAQKKHYCDSRGFYLRYAQESLKRMTQGGLF